SSETGVRQTPQCKSESAASGSTAVVLPAAGRVGIVGAPRMSVICFVSYEIHPTTRGGCGVLIHHAAERLLAAGHDVVLLLDMPEPAFRRFVTHHRALELAEAILTPSRTYFARYYRPLYGLDADRVVVSPPPRQQFPSVARRPDPAGPFTILFLGRLSVLKGIEQLVHAAVRLVKRRPDLPFTVELIGHDTDVLPSGQIYGAYLRSLIPGELRDRFVFTGQLPHGEVAARLAHALFAVFPNRVESFCYALHEVYDAGVPVIVNDLPSFADFFRHEDNALVYDGTTEG